LANRPPISAPTGVDRVSVAFLRSSRQRASRGITVLFL
jgi:hypothetical protein